MSNTFKERFRRLGESIKQIQDRLSEVERLNNSRDNGISAKTTPNDHSLQAIQDVLDEHHEVRLERGVVYEGPTKLEIWPQDEDGATSKRIDARGAAVNFTGDGDTAVDIGPHEGHWGGRIHIEGGVWSGPGKYDGADAAIRVTDHFGVDIRVFDAKNATHGVLARNVDAFCERPRVHIGEPIDGFDGSADLGSKPLYSVRLAGNDSDLIDDSMSMTDDSPWHGWDNDPSTESSGTNSFREADVCVKFRKPADGGKYIWQDRAEMQGANTAVAGFIPSDGHMVHSDGWNPGHVIELEVEGGSGIGVENSNDFPPMIFNPRIHDQNLDVNYINSGAGNMRVVRPNGDLFIGATPDDSDESRYRVHHKYDFPRTTVNDELTVNHPRTSYQEQTLMRLQEGGVNQLSFYRNGAWNHFDLVSNNDWPVHFLDSNHDPVPIRAEKVDIGSDGGGLYMNDDGDACVDDENGNSINLSALSDR